MPSLRPRFWGELNAIIEKNNLYKVDGSIASYETRAKRREVIHAGFRYLASAGCRLTSPIQFKEKHMKKLVPYWEKENIADIQTRISIFRTFGNHWIRKPGMIKESERYANNPQSVKRKYVTNVDKTWTGHGVDVLDMVQKVTVLDARVGLLMELGVAFGARLKEAMGLHPHTDLKTVEDKKGNKREYIHVRNGKGGLQRDIEIEQSGPLRDYQLELIERAKTIAARPGASLIKDGKSTAYQRNRVYYILRKAGVARKLNGVTFHGLRHEYAVAYYERRTGVAAPLKGNPEKPDPALDQKTREDLSENLGHSRTSIVGCYIGSRHRPVPQTGGPEAAKTEEAGSKDVSDAAGAKADPEKPDSKGE
jgi:hypothetical protein